MENINNSTPGPKPDASSSLRLSFTRTVNLRRENPASHCTEATEKVVSQKNNNKGAEALFEYGDKRVAVATLVDCRSQSCEILKSLLPKTLHSWETNSTCRPNKYASDDVNMTGAIDQNWSMRAAGNGGLGHE